MKRNIKYIYSFIALLAYTLVLAHNVIPHHHHDSIQSKVVVSEASHCCEHSNEEEEHNHTSEVVHNHNAEDDCCESCTFSIDAVHNDFTDFFINSGSLDLENLISTDCDKTKSQNVIPKIKRLSSPTSPRAPPVFHA